MNARMSPPCLQLSFYLHTIDLKTMCPAWFLSTEFDKTKMLQMARVYRISSTKQSKNIHFLNIEEIVLQ